MLPLASSALHLLDAAAQAAAPIRVLQREVLVARHILVPIVALGLERRPRRPLLDAVGAYTALDTALTLVPSSSLAVAAAHIGADTHNTLYEHLSLLLTLCVTHKLT